MENPRRVFVNECWESYEEDCYNGHGVYSKRFTKKYTKWLESIVTGEYDQQILIGCLVKLYDYFMSFEQVKTIDFEWCNIDGYTSVLINEHISYSKDKCKELFACMIINASVDILMKWGMGEILLIPPPTTGTSDSLKDGVVAYKE